MTAFLFWLEDSPLGAFVRSLGVWSYGILNLVHILGIAMLFGAILVLDLRLLGLWRGVPLAVLSRPTVQLAVTGFCLAAISGVPMLAVKAGDYADNPFLLIKFPAILLALGNIWLVHRSRAWQAHRVRGLVLRERRWLALSASVSLVLWLTVIASGRMIGYW